MPIVIDENQGLLRDAWRCITIRVPYVRACWCPFLAGQTVSVACYVLKLGTLALNHMLIFLEAANKCRPSFELPLQHGMH